MPAKSLWFLIPITLAVALPAAAKGMPSRFRDWFPISGWWGPNKDQVTGKVYEDMAAAGLTLGLGHPSWAVGLGERAGLKMIIYDERVDRAQKVETETECDSLIDSVAQEYGKNPNIVGFSVRDEPMPPDFPRLARISKRLCEKVPGCFPFINLFPNYVSEWLDSPPKYEEYVRQFVKEVDPPILCFDHYPFIHETMRDNYYENLDTIRRVALDAGVPFWGFIQITAHSVAREPTEAELRLQVFSHLVYGAGGISYFCFWLPAPKGDFIFSGAILDDRGNRTEYFEQVQRINRRIKDMAGVLLNARSTGVYHTGKVPKSAVEMPKRFPVRVKEGWAGQGKMFFATGQLIFGFFEGPGDDRYVMIVNRDYAHNLWTRLELAPEVRALEEIGGPEVGGSRGLLPDVGAKERLVPLFIRAGDGRLFKLVPDRGWSKAAAQGQT